jgi:hypothetical protein
MTGLPGMATNLLIERLRNLEADGVLTRGDDGRYALTAWGEDLHEAIYALGRWAGPLMAKPRGSDQFRPTWIRHMVIARFEGLDALRKDLTVELTIDSETMTLISARGRVHLVRGSSDSPDVKLAGPTEPVVGLLLGRIRPSIAKSRGVRTSGDVRRLRGLRPRGEQPASHR